MREFFRIIAEQARHMRGLIGDLLDTGRIESGSGLPKPFVIRVSMNGAASASCPSTEQSICTGGYSTARWTI